MVILNAIEEILFVGILLVTPSRGQSSRKVDGPNWRLRAEVAALASASKKIDATEFTVKTSKSGADVIVTILENGGNHRVLSTSSWSKSVALPKFASLPRRNLAFAAAAFWRLANGFFDNRDERLYAMVYNVETPPQYAGRLVHIKTETNIGGFTAHVHLDPNLKPLSLDFDY